MNCKIIADRTENLEAKYAATKDIYLETGRLRQQSGFSHVVAGEKRTVELQLSSECGHACIGCAPHRGVTSLGQSKLYSQDALERTFALLGIDKPTSDSNRWRIQLSGANSDPLWGSRSHIWKRFFELSQGHTVVIHTAMVGSPALRTFMRAYFDSHHFQSGGNLVVALSLDTPVYPTHDENLLMRNVRYYQAKFTVSYPLIPYLNIIQNAAWLKGALEALKIPRGILTIIAKQIIFLEDTGRDKLFSIDDGNSINNVLNAMYFWSEVASLYRLSPAYIYNLSRRIPLQEKFERWVMELKALCERRESFPDIDIAYRRFTAQPERTDRPGVSEFQYTINPLGFFTPCDYSDRPIPGLPSIHDPSLTKERVDEAYAGLTYKTKPCISCDHHTCFHDTYGVEEK